MIGSSCVCSTTNDMGWIKTVSDSSVVLVKRQFNHQQITVTYLLAEWNLVDRGGYYALYRR